MGSTLHDAEALLADVEKESLQQLLNAARSSAAGITRIPAIDAHIRSVFPEQSTPLSTLRRGDVIEIQGPSSSGKTHLLYHLIGTCVLPAKFAGWNKVAVVFDVDGTFDVRRFHHLLHSRIAAASTSELDQNMADAARVTALAMRSLRIFRPSSSIQLAASLANLAAYHAGSLPSSEVALLAVDSMSAHYWPDRFRAEEARLQPPPATAVSKSAPNLLHTILVEMERFRASHRPVIVMTTWGLNPTYKESNASIVSYKQHLHPFPTLMSANALAPSTPGPDPYPPLTHHITLNVAPMPPFPPGARLSDVHEEDERFTLMMAQRGKSIGLVRTSGKAETAVFGMRVAPSQVIFTEEEKTIPESLPVNIHER
ncbi:hypothetical protein BV25DRAFT_1846398 [Artomyces pyxidatus]|uniref:Uncharacterized protein n=1 Tax=Artomyces pyxidatus TaxID=48021 RepID=A0ACB8TJ08_9AGAM|nr:hypothetical protein BV25DRAFT_1846398 [Artomyces pyxidatus]